MSKERDSLEILSERLGQDYSFIEKNLDDDPDGFWSRTYIKTTISLFEAEIFALKQRTLNYCSENKIRLEPELSLLLNNKKYEISSNGGVKERLLQIRLKDDIKFVYSQILSIKSHTLYADYEEVGWSKVISTIAVRNRLTHPKSIGDIIVSKQELGDCKLAFKWFIDNLVHFLSQDRNDIENHRDKQMGILQRRIDELEGTEGKSKGDAE